MDFDKETMILTACSTTVPLLIFDNSVWFKGNDCATVLAYKDPKRAIKRHVDAEWQAPLEDLLRTLPVCSRRLREQSSRSLATSALSAPSGGFGSCTLLFAVIGE